MNWQLTITLVLVVFAGCYLARRAWQTWRGGGKGCGQCASKKEKKESGLISIDTLRLTQNRPGERGA